MKALTRRVVEHFFVLTLPLLVLASVGMTFSDTDDREELALLLTLPFAAIFLTVSGRAIFETFRAIINRALTEALKVYWLVSAAVFLFWVGSLLALLWR